LAETAAETGVNHGKANNKPTITDVGWFEQAICGNVGDGLPLGLKYIEIHF